MRTKLLMMSGVALLAGTLVAAAQSIQPGGGAQDKGASQGQMSQPGKEQSDKALPEKVAPNRNAQSKQGARGQAEGKEPAKTTGQAKGKDSPTTNGQASGARDQDKKPQGQTQGQAPRDQDRQPGQTPQGQTQQNRQQGQTQRDQEVPKQGQSQRDQGTQQGSSNTNVSVSFTAEQRTKIRETVFKGSNAPRMSNVNFSISVGTVVPRTVRVIEVPDVIVEIHPQWRGYRYFIVKEEIIIVDPDTLRIVAVIEV